MVCEALNDARRLAIHHPALLAPILEKVVLGIMKTTKNPRSAVLKTSVMACTDVFVALGDLSLSSSCSSSLSKAMRAMATSMPPLPLLEAQGPRPPHQPQGPRQGHRRHGSLRRQDGTHAQQMSPKPWLQEEGQPPPPLNNAKQAQKLYCGCIFCIIQ